MIDLKLGLFFQKLKKSIFRKSKEKIKKRRKFIHFYEKGKSNLFPKAVAFLEELLYGPTRIVVYGLYECHTSIVVQPYESCIVIAKEKLGLHGLQFGL